MRDSSIKKVLLLGSGALKILQRVLLTKFISCQCSLISWSASSRRSVPMAFS